MQIDLISLRPPLRVWLLPAPVVRGVACAGGQGPSPMASNHVLAPLATPRLVYSAALEATASVPKVSVKRSCWGHVTNGQFSLENS